MIGGMWILYILALIPVGIGFGLWRFLQEKVSLSEFAICSSLAFVAAGVIHLFAVIGMTSDTETWSGQVSSITRFPQWVSWYNHAVYRTVPDIRTTMVNGKLRTHVGTKQVFSHYERRHKTHHEKFVAETTLGQSLEIGGEDFLRLTECLGGKLITEDNGCNNFVSGDSNRYVCRNTSGFVAPVTKTVSFVNKAKASPSTFSFKKVPKDISGVFDYPRNDNVFTSGRLLGKAAEALPIAEWDRLNSRVGSSKKVNLVMIGFGNQQSSIAEWQRNAWFNGKKNDLVICYGGSDDPSNAEWAYVFGWTERNDVKKHLQEVMVSSPIDMSILPKIEEVVRKEYEIKDWKKMDYIKVSPTPSVYAWFVALQILMQGIAWCIARNN